MYQSSQPATRVETNVRSQHLHFLRSIETDNQGRDLIDRELDDMIVVDPYEVHGPSRRSDKDLGDFLTLLDSLETSNDRKEATR